MKKQFLILCICCLAAGTVFSQALFTYGTNEVSKDEFLRAFNKNITGVENKEKAMKEYLEMYSKFKLKVKGAREMKLDTLEQLRYDVMNFRRRLETDFPVEEKIMMEKIGFKRNNAVSNEMLYLFGDSAAYSKQGTKFPIAKEVMFTIAGTPVKTIEWMNFAREYKLDKNKYKGESNDVLLKKFISKTASDYYYKHLEEYNADFKYQLQEFKEGNLLFEAMGKKVWAKATSDPTVLKNYYESNKDHFLWTESADVILITAKSYAYADYANENMKGGKNWQAIAANSESMILSDSGRYETAQLPIKPGTKLVEGTITEVVKNENDNSAGFVKIVKVYPSKLQRTYDEAKSLVINEYQKKLEDTWMNELEKRYPVKVNEAVLQSLLK